MKQNGKREILKFWAAALAVSSILTLFAWSGILDQADQAVSDALYQSRTSLDGEIVIIGIDQRAINEIGPYNSWGRDVMAQILERLNKSEQCRPAVIGIDVVYDGEKDGEADRYLAREAGRYGNVVTACLAEFGEVAVLGEDGEYYLEPFSVTALGSPYAALRDVTDIGHINAMLDGQDGILRHHLLFIRLPDKEEIPSMALVAAQKYREFCGADEITVPPVNKEGFWYLPFYGRPGDFEVYSAADVLSGRVTAEYLAGKIVLIGPYAAGLQDSYLSAADHAEPMYGVEFHANAIKALLEGDYKKEAGRGIQLWLLFAALLIGMIGFWNRPVGPATALWAVLGGGYLLLCRWMYGRGWVLHVLWIPVGVTVLYAVCLASNYIRAALERRQVTNTFKKYVAPEIVNEILQKGTEALELGGKQTRIAVLFVDVRGFTPMSELLEPAQVVEILNGYLGLISKCILDHGGTLDKFVGDAAMAFWGAPLPQEDYVMKAVQAAAAMVKGSQALSGQLLERYGRTVSFGIGVHVGEAVVGNVGSPQRMDYTAIGDTVNTAARLEANAPGGTIYISRAVADALAGRIRVTSLGDTVKLKGKKEGFEVLTMDGICGE